MTNLSDLSILEGKYDRITTLSSRLLINMIKKGRKRGKFELKLNNVANIKILDDVDFQVPIYVDVKFQIKYDKTAVSAFDIAGMAEDDLIELSIVINPNYLPNSLSDLVPTMKEAMRHELEHVAQANGLRPSSENYEAIEMSFSDLKDPAVKLGRYFLLKHEVPAFVRGLYKAAKTRRQPIDVTIDYFLDGYEHRLRTGDSNKIKRIWKLYAKKNLPAAQWSR